MSYVQLVVSNEALLGSQTCLGEAKETTDEYRTGKVYAGETRNV